MVHDVVLINCLGRPRGIFCTCTVQNNPPAFQIVLTHYFGLEKRLLSHTLRRRHTARDFLYVLTVSAYNSYCAVEEPSLETAGPKSLNKPSNKRSKPIYYIYAFIYHFQITFAAKSGFLKSHFASVMDSLIYRRPSKPNEAISCSIGI